MKKILQTSDGQVRLIDNTRELDEVFEFLHGKNNRPAKIHFLITEENGARKYAANLNGGHSCTVYPLGHPEAPEVTPC